ncbi:choline/ethanolamine kinase--aminoglycoside phosphotransferase [Rhodococcus sp. 06-470-2]|uniref:choline kinase family protein n=1 Tax=unclassified Rhodococcus (in: high G+C Gram-positive bacteria) TaxID=192944 RepID=UPI000B9B71CC|nr:MULTISPECIES: choline kinase family protein [unclassified Rhodococcus (in: high G+C Gram-positive bacteria)]OZC63420.1 choline/ethanolamine kinase--aminoglycoside phosphotransferase [Rhodococcus sp. 06-470-2]OZE61387.1 choline/ethanolamine kinase--aminoglycoside phosphotransferase [Rhodococcus sp. 05-2221-1B]
MNEIALGSARTEPERQVEKALAAVAEWEGLNITYAPVPGGLMNSNWRITVEGKPKRYFMKLPGAGTDSFIDRSLANEAARRAGALDIGPEVVLFDPVTGVEVIEFLEGYRACTNGDLKRPEIPMGMIDVYRVLHSGSKLSITKTIFDMIDEHLDQVAELGVRLPRDAELILAEYGQAKNAMLASGLDLVACHNDPMPGNILIGDGMPMKLVDYEFASNNDRAYELAVMITEMFYGEQQTMELIEEFYGKAEWSMISRVQVCSALADVKWGLWGCMNHKLSTAWDFDYHKYGTWKLARARMKMADPRWAFWLQGL